MTLDPDPLRATRADASAMRPQTYAVRGQALVEGFVRRLEDLRARSHEARLGRPLALLLGDCDKFEAIARELREELASWPELAHGLREPILAAIQAGLEALVELRLSVCDRLPARATRQLRIHSPTEDRP